jgi:isoleucyl-tRNA synthetase
MIDEEEILAFWKRENIFEKSLAQDAPKGDFVFYDGPPFATGLPHIGSLLSSIIKDVVPRYKTMRGYHVARRWGWDCHGLPIESEVEKKLGLKTKKDILTVGIDVFNETARSMVLQYVDEWERYVTRVGRWVDFKNSYKTMDNSYIESVWWALKQLNDKKLLYEGRKVLMYCTHCETPLAKAEIAMDNTYKEVTDEALTVKFKIKNPKKYDLPENTFLLAWTTTPWTLPGNAALAVGKKIAYGVVESGNEHHLSAAPGGSLFGADLVGIEYEPLFDVPALRSSRSYKVYAADFVSTEEGTGIVHVAPMYGEDDFALGQKEKLPMVQLLTQSGSYNAKAPALVQDTFFKKGGKLIADDLEARGLVFAKEMHTHSYPHCYRCGSPLIYNAVTSWFINIQKVKQKMLSENQKITWVPAHLRDGRFKHIVENAPDWTISRNRFWASPLPIWKEKGGTKLMVVESVEELLSKTKKSGNRYFVMRHGEAEQNVLGIISSSTSKTYNLTEEGKNTAHREAEKLKGVKIDMICTSPLLRAQQTAHIAAKVLGVSANNIFVDERLREVEFGVLEGRPKEEHMSGYDSPAQFELRPDGGESSMDVKKRVGEFIFEIESRYPGKNILIVSHGNPLWLLTAAAQGATKERAWKMFQEQYPQKGVIQELPFVPYPHNAQYELDLHRPYIDAIELVDGKGATYERIPEVIDCWVESGAMPFASAGYPKDKTLVNPTRLFGLMPKGYPADFIAEYIAQTRTWFYYMHAMGVLLFNRSSFRAVVSTGTMLAGDGSKMSKSKKNYTDPYELMERYGADALRLHLLGSVVMQSEDLKFRDEDVREAARTLSTLQNCLQFFELYKHEQRPGFEARRSPHVLDRWILARLEETTAHITLCMDAYDTPMACRLLKQLIDDYSTWYVRRSRVRVKSADQSDKQFCLATQRHVLRMCAQIIAPIAPFIAEDVYRGVDDRYESVHLSEWPNAAEISIEQQRLTEDMAHVRALASFGLQARERAGIKLRQPLAKLVAKKLPSDPDLREVLKDELNIKEVEEDATQEEEVTLDLVLTEELREEGLVREFARAIQDWRKQEKMQMSDRPHYVLTVSASDKHIAEKYKADLIAQTNLGSLEIEAE